MVSGYDTTGSGAYTLHFARGPGANEGGFVASRSTARATLGRGDIDSYTIGAIAGQSIELTVTDVDATALVPLIEVFDPTGARVVPGYGQTIASARFTARHTGVYTLVITD